MVVGASFVDDGAGAAMLEGVFLDDEGALV